MKKILLAFFAMMLLQPVLASSNKLLIPTPILGGGYSDDMQMPMGMSCLKPGELNFTGGTKSVISLGKSYTFDEIQKELNINVSGEASIGLFSFDASANYARYIKNTSYSESFYFLEKISLPTQYLSTEFGTNALNSFGWGAYKTSPEQFRISCGNKFYQQVDLGVNFFTTFKIVFNSTFDKAVFDASLNGNYGNFGSAKASIQQIVQQKNIRGTLEISAYQEGGDPTQLPKIFSKCTDHYCVTTCSLDNLDACQGVIDGIINYAQNHLPKQIDFDPESKKVKGNANPLHYEYMSYTQIGLADTSTQLSPEIIAARQYLGHLYKETIRQQELIDHVLNSQIAANIVRTYKTKLIDLSETLHANASLLESNEGAIGCYLKPNQCVAIKTNIDALLKPIDKTVLEMFRIGFIVRGPSGPYLAIPIGGDQYQWFNHNATQFTSQGMMKFLDNKILHVDGIDIWSERYTGEFAETGTDTYSGYLHYNTGRSIPHQITTIENPI